jgi:hypothetical protein
MAAPQQPSLRSGRGGGGALVHESKSGHSSATLQLLSGSNREGFWHSKIRHPIQDVAGDHRLGFLRLWMPSTKPWTNDCLVPKESVLHSGLVMVPRLLSSEQMGRRRGSKPPRYPTLRSSSSSLKKLEPGRNLATRSRNTNSRSCLAMVWGCLGITFKLMPGRLWQARMVKRPEQKHEECSPNT